MTALRETMHAIGLEEASYGIKDDIVNMKFDARPTGGLGRLRVKLEFNTRETTPCFELIRRPYAVSNPWFSGRARPQPRGEADPRRVRARPRPAAAPATRRLQPAGGRSRRPRAPARQAAMTLWHVAEAGDSAVNKRAAQLTTGSRVDASAVDTERADGAPYR